MIDPVAPELNLRNLDELFARIHDLEAFIFFGTLLGYTRERGIIPHDDDIDIYVNRKHLRPLLKMLAATDFSVELMPRHEWYKFWRRPCLVQATRVLDGVQTYADFYLYDARPADHLVEKWNFRGRWHDPTTDIHVPKDLIFPLQTGSMQGVDVKVPAKPEQVCAYLYGPTWKTPVKKDGGYTMKVVGNKPSFQAKVPENTAK